MVSNSDYSLTLQSTSSIPLAMKIKKYELYFRTPKPQVTLYDQMKAFFYIVHGNEAVMHEFPFMVSSLLSFVMHEFPFMVSLEVSFFMHEFPFMVSLVVSFIMHEFPFMVSSLVSFIMHEFLFLVGL